MARQWCVPTVEFTVPAVDETLDPVDVTTESPGAASDPTRYRWSHRSLLVDIFGPDRPVLQWDSTAVGDPGPLLGEACPDGVSHHQLGGLLLPTSRSFAEQLPGLTLAVDLALAHQCILVVICSRAAKVEEFPVEFAERLGASLILVHLDDCDKTWLPTLNSARHRLSTLHRRNDVGSKRNIGLAFAVAMGWEFLLLIDDDIAAAADGPTLDAENLAHALAVMNADPQLKAIGWTLEDYDDNSVVGHARPLADLAQGIFIGGGALLVRCEPELSFFPDVYNEDWLFLIALAAAAKVPRAALGLGGRVHQRSYAPFWPKRARSEEVGEIIGECLMNLLEDRGAGFTRGLTVGHWRRSLANRWGLLQLIKERVGRLPVRGLGAPDGIDPADQQCLMDSMSAAQRVHSEIRPKDLQEFVRLWRYDQETWQQHLRKLEGGLTLIRDPRLALIASPF